MSPHLGLVLIFIVFVATCTKPVHADSNLIKILDVQVQPSTVKVNNTFSVSATILNNSTYPVYLTSGSCVPAFSIKFDSHAKQVYSDIACTLEKIIQRVDPNVETTISNVNKPGTIYKSIQAGTANANITIPYFAKNQTATDYSNINYNVSKSFQFKVYGVNETSAPPNSMGTPNGGWVTPLQTHEKNGTKLTIHYEVGTLIIGNYPPPPPPPKNLLPVQQYGNFESPLKQFKSGMPAKDVKCEQDLHLVIKAEDGSPACVTPDTAQKLMERGWAKKSYNTTFDAIQSDTTQEKIPVTINGVNSDYSFNCTITGGQIEQARADIMNKELVLSIKSTESGMLIADLPRTLIDAKMNGQDTQFIVLEDGREVLYKQTASTIQSRILNIPFQYGVSQIEIIAPTSIQ